MKIYKIFKYIILIIIVCYLYSMFSIYYYSKEIYKGNADAIIVLGAAAWGNKPSPVFRERINHALKIFKQGRAKYLVFTGGPGYPSEPGESVIAKKYAIKNGISEDKILIEKTSKNTWENLFYAKKLLESYELKKIILVSDPFHLKRAAVIAKSIGLDVKSSATTTSRYRSYKIRLKFILKEAYYLSLYNLELLLVKLNLFENRTYYYVR